MLRMLRTVAVCLVLAAGSASAQTLTVGVRSGTDAIDPHFGATGNSVSIQRNMFDTLVSRDESLQPIPCLALSWRAIDDNTWEFRLRPGVKFHDGSDFTAADVKFSIERIPGAAGPTGGMMLYMTGIQEVRIIDPLTVRIITNTPTPLLPRNLAQVFIVSHRIGAMELSIRDYSAIPVVTLETIWAGRRDRVAYVPRNDEETNVLMMRRRGS